MEKPRRIIQYFVIICVGVSLLGVATAQQSTCAAGEILEPSGACETLSSNDKAWLDEVGGQFQKFLQDRIFGQQVATAGSSFMSHLEGGGDDGGESRSDDKAWDASKDGSLFLDMFGAPGENPIRTFMDHIADFGKPKDLAAAQTSTGKQDLVFSLLESVQHIDEEHGSVNGPDLFKIIKDAFEIAMNQLKDAFGDVLEEVGPSTAVSMTYYLATEDSRKNPSWKRRQHRFFKGVSKDVILEMHDALYLSQVAYMNSLDDIRKELKGFQNDEWVLAYGTTDSLPHMPAHFLLLHKNLAPLVDTPMRSILPWDSRRDSELTAVLAVRGTKDIGDVLADIMLTPVAYRDGHAHGGILENGKNLTNRYLPKLEALLKHSGRQKLRLYVVGHSLGAAAAAIAAIEFHEYDWITVEAIGFGCPSLLSLELSESTKDYITTVVADSDIIPRMSGASVANLLLDLLEFDWTDMALEDIEFTMDRAISSFAFGKLLPTKAAVLNWAIELIEKEVKPRLARPKRERIPNVLIPPGSCVHMYRDGIGYSAVYTPCSFFSSIDLSRTLIDDHLVVPGYHRALVTIMRDWQENFNVSATRYTTISGG